VKRGLKRAVWANAFTRGRRRVRAAALCSAILVLGYSTASAQEDSPPISRTIFGNIGLINNPSARMAPDGELYFGADFFKNTQHYDVGFQALPWLETSFRYSGLQHFVNVALPVYFDRSFAVKARLWNEGDILPAVAVGINDLVGTGIYSGEYLVASKQFGPIDASIGLGWGRISSSGGFSNPLGKLSTSFFNRPRPADYGGQFALNAYFHSPKTAAFGGINWRTPLDGLTLTAEYSSDAMTVEASSGNFRPHSQFSYGATYQLSNSVFVGLDWLYGTSLGATLTFTLDPYLTPFPQKIGTPQPTVAVRTQEQQQAALNNLQRSGISDQRKAQLTDEFANTLYLSGVSDVRISGRQLVLLGDGTASLERCGQFAEMARSYNIGLDAVMLTSNTLPPKTIRCGTPRLAPAPIVLDGSALRNFDDARVFLIDGASDQPRGPTELRRATAKIRAALRTQGILSEAVSLSGSDVTVYFTNAKYRTEDEAFSRLTRVLMAEAPSSVERFHLVALSSSLPVRMLDVLRAPMERSIEGDPTGTELLDHAILLRPTSMGDPILAHADESVFPRFGYDFFPNFRQMLFDPAQPFGVQFLAVGTANLELWRGFAIRAEAEYSLYDTFDTSIPNNTSLPPVRTNFNRYFTEGKNGIGNLEADYSFRLSPEIYAIARGGILESMFDGVGGEVLWRPDGRRWAVGIDGFEVRQRGFLRLFDLQSYQVFTGHVSLYYSSPWYGLNFALRAGQYLAGDRGATFEISRRFDSGVEVGVFATKTNVSTMRFGEGSFDKGITLRIPMDYMLPISSQASFTTTVRPIQRDGGQRMLGDAILYSITDPDSEGEIRNHMSDFAVP
jgi:hypothetical protein